MRKRLDGPPWRVALASIALLATLMALYVQLFERRSRLTEDRLAAARLEKALDKSRLRLKAEILAQLRTELAKERPTERPDNQPLPNAVLRRSESGAGGVLEQVLDSTESQEAAQARFQETLDSLTRQMEQSDRQTRQDVEELRAELRREQEVSRKVVSLLLIALIPLVLHLLAALWPSGEAKPKDAP